MNIKVAPLAGMKHTVMVVFCWQSKPLTLPANAQKDGVVQKGFSALVADASFKGEKGEKRLLYLNGRLASHVVVVGLGKQKKMTVDGFRRVIADTLIYINRAKLSRVAFDLSPLIPLVFKGDEAVSLMSEVAQLTLYRFQDYKTKNARKKKNYIKEIIINNPADISRASAQQAVRTGNIIAETTNCARTLINEPANTLTPMVFAKRIARCAAEVGVKCTVLKRKQIEKERMGGLIAVSQGSRQEPVFVVLEYRPAKQTSKNICLVGKGVCFDSGGISLKPSLKMDLMKYDMAGGAAAAATICGAARLGLPQRITALVPLCENMPDGNAYRPGDVITTRSGLTVEVHNTDAEGRMILIDALDYAKQYNPDVVIDLATLTGAAKVCLGDKAAAVMGSDEILIEALQSAGEAVGERLWQLPLWDEYQDDIESDIADLKHIGYKGAGTITAGKFLSHFAPKCAWAHLDIAAVAWEDEGKGYRPKGATGFGVRLLLSYLKNNA